MNDDRILHRLTHEAAAGPLGARDANELLTDHARRWPECDHFHGRDRDELALAAIR